jgi:hypothetical protein
MKKILTTIFAIIIIANSSKAHTHPDGLIGFWKISFMKTTSICHDYEKNIVVKGDILNAISIPESENFLILIKRKIMES